MKRSAIVVVVILGIVGCAAPRTVSFPVVLTDEERAASHARHEIIGTVSVSRTRFGHDPFTADDRSWAEDALREEAWRLGADAITPPEVTISSETVLFVPLSEVRARSQAIRFR